MVYIMELAEIYKENINIEFTDKTERNFELTNPQIWVN